MKVLFASGVEGGSFRSTLELARALEGRGHDVVCLVTSRDHARQKYVHKRMVNLRTKLGSGSVAGRLVAGFAGRLGRRTSEWGHSPRVLKAAIIENAVSRLMDSQGWDVVVAASLERVAWRDILAHARAREIAAVLYLREMVAVGHLTISEAPPDLLLANASILAEAARAAGHEAKVVPSVIDLSRSTIESSRELALLVNPIESHGLDLALSVADRLPQVEFLFQESWAIAAGPHAALVAAINTRPNVTLRAPVPSSDQVYARARVLLVPHLVENRPRVILEAMANGLPVLVADRPGLREVAGEAGVILPQDDPEAWANELARLWTDDSHYEELSRRSLARAASPELSADGIVERFEALVEPLVRSRNKEWH